MLVSNYRKRSPASQGITHKNASTIHLDFCKICQIIQMMRIPRKDYTKKLFGDKDVRSEDDTRATNIHAKLSSGLKLLFRYICRDQNRLLSPKFMFFEFD
jgi:hypothetical protein